MVRKHVYFELISSEVMNTYLKWVKSVAEDFESARLPRMELYAGYAQYTHRYSWAGVYNQSTSIIEKNDDWLVCEIAGVLANRIQV